MNNTLIWLYLHVDFICFPIKLLAFKNYFIVLPWVNDDDDHHHYYHCLFYVFMCVSVLYSMSIIMLSSDSIDGYMADDTFFSSYNNFLVSHLVTFCIWHSSEVFLSSKFYFLNRMKFYYLHYNDKYIQYTVCGMANSRTIFFYQMILCNPLSRALELSTIRNAMKVYEKISINCNGLQFLLALFNDDFINCMYI